MADLIDRQALLRDVEKYHLSDGKFQHWVEVQQSADAVKVVRCKNCKYSYESVAGLICSYGVCVDCLVSDNFYCAYGERNEAS